MGVDMIYTLLETMVVYIAHLYVASISKECIDMETGNLIHLGAELVVQMLMLYSTSPHARRLTSEMLTGDAFNIDIKLDDEAKNRNVEILNVYLKTMGLRLVFEKYKKKPIPGFLVAGMSFNRDPSMLTQGFSFYHPDEKIDVEKNVERLLKTKHEINAFSIAGMSFYGRNDRTIEEEEAEREEREKNKH